MSKKNHRSSVFTLSIVLLNLMFSACGSKDVPITKPAGAQAGDLVAVEPCTYKANIVKYEADCGRLIVPPSMPLD